MSCLPAVFTAVVVVPVVTAVVVVVDSTQLELVEGKVLLPIFSSFVCLCCHNNWRRRVRPSFAQFALIKYKIYSVFSIYIYTSTYLYIN